MSFSTLLLRMRSSIWYLPSLYGFAAVALALTSTRFDSYIVHYESFHRMIPTFLFADIDLARTILSSISASLLTMTTITFSTILVVLTTYLSEFSPRTLQNFIMDQSTQRVLGIFVGGFIYSILLLLLLREDGTTTTFIVPSFAVLFAIICLIVFVFFIHHVTKWIQVSSLIHNITLTTMKKIESELTDRKEVHEDAPWEDWENDEIKHLPAKKLCASSAGYIQHININGIVEQATKDDCIVRIEKKISEYVDEDTPLLSLWVLSEHDVKGNYLKFISIGPEITPMDDIEFGLTKIVEIGLRALSSGINDPNTAINCIENLGKILTKLGKKQLPRSFHNDSQRNLRVILDKPDFSDYLYTCFYQIRQNGFHDISVLSAGIKALTLIAENNSPKIKEIIWEFTEYIIEGIDRTKLLSLDKRYINHKLEILAHATERTKSFKPL
ncbi:DUF2254 domain-containing protein [Anaerobacillus sp. MEB173]|uniref:DUF2254 domain-containing protein n=1 Tax=Anaerobacillus sp. MEB173 TaxID=3383345 RepID=UPI003F90FE56